MLIRNDDRNNIFYIIKTMYVKYINSRYRKVMKNWKNSSIKHGKINTKLQMDKLLLFR